MEGEGGDGDGEPVAGNHGGWAMSTEQQPARPAGFLFLQVAAQAMALSLRREGKSEVEVERWLEGEALRVAGPVMADAGGRCDG